MHAFTPRSQQAESWHRKRPQDWPLACCSECSASYLCHSAATEGLKGSANQQTNKQTNRGGGVRQKQRERVRGGSEQWEISPHKEEAPEKKRDISEEEGQIKW